MLNKITQLQGAKKTGQLEAAVMNLSEYRYVHVIMYNKIHKNSISTKINNIYITVLTLTQQLTHL